MAQERSQRLRFIWQRLDDIHATVSDLKRGLELMASQTMVRQSELESIKYQVASLAEGQVELEKRIEKLENKSSLISWILRQTATVLMVIVAAYLASLWF
jgi:hypothetical protein